MTDFQPTHRHKVTGEKLQRITIDGVDITEMTRIKTVHGYYYFVDTDMLEPLAPTEKWENVHDFQPTHRHKVTGVLYQIVEENVESEQRFKDLFGFYYWGDSAMLEPLVLTEAPVRSRLAYLERQVADLTKCIEDDAAKVFRQENERLQADATRLREALVLIKRVAQDEHSTTFTRNVTNLIDQALAGKEAGR